MNTMNTNTLESLSDRTFSCTVENIKKLSDLISCLHVSGNKVDASLICSIEITTDQFALTTTNRSKTYQACVNLDQSFFENYFCKSEKINVSVNLNLLLESFHVLNSTNDSVKCTIIYKEAESLLILSFEESGIYVTINITTIHTDGNEGFQPDDIQKMTEDDDKCTIILKSDILKDAFHELIDYYNAKSVTIEINIESGLLILSTITTIGVCVLKFTKTSPDSIVAFTCSSSLTFSYSIESFLSANRSLAIATETQLCMRSNGFLQLLNRVEDDKEGQDAYIDFLVFPQDVIHG